MSWLLIGLIVVLVIIVLVLIGAKTFMTFAIGESVFRDVQGFGLPGNISACPWGWPIEGKYGQCVNPNYDKEIAQRKKEYAAKLK
jgi:hypothetical protein